MRYKIVLQVRPLGALGDFYKRLSVEVWNFKQADAQDAAFAGAQAMGWEVSKIISCKNCGKD